MLNKVLISLLLLVGSAVLFNCSKEVNCRATVYLTIKNNLTEAIQLKYVTVSDVKGKDTMGLIDGGEVILNNDTMKCSEGKFVDDTIRYFWTMENECRLTYSKIGRYSCALMVFHEDTLLNKYIILPWDTVNSSGKKIDNCHEETWDTLVIE